ncbi:putative peptidyl-prolyl cis-trans isomerase [Trypoxylus dichotomus]
MFWGLIMEPQRRYTQTVKKAFHISMAALDESTSDDSPTQVICSYDDRNYLLCTLQKGKTIQVSLDLNYEVGDKISFATNGKAHVHLTGYLLEEQFPLEGSEEEEEEDEDQAVKSSVGKKRQKEDLGNSPPKKKSKTLELLNAVNSNDEDDSDDSDVNMSDLMDEEDDTLDTTALEEDDEEEDDEEDDDDSDDEEEVKVEESDEESSTLSEDDLVKQTKKVMENGVASKKQKKRHEKLQQQEQQQTPTQQQKSEKQKKDKSTKIDKTPGKGEKASVKGDKTPGKTPSKSPKQEGGSPQKKTVEGGVVIEDVKVGNGPVAKPGKIVKVYYEGRFKTNNKMFDSTTKGPGFEFRLGRQEVIKGWDVGLAGMKVGGKRRIICPPNMAYGQKGSPPTIPPNSTLVFDVELKNVK